MPSEIHVTEIDREAEAEICKRRGHSPSNVILTSDPPQNVCKWCGANYRTTSPQTIDYTPPGGLIPLCQSQ